MVFSNPWTPSLRRSLPLRPSTSVVPIGDTREESTAGKEDRKSLQKRLEQFADNVNSHPDSIGRRIDLALQPTVRKVWSSSRITSIRILRRLDMATHTRIRSTKQAEEKDPEVPLVRPWRDQPLPDISRPPGEARSAMTVVSLRF